MNNFVQNKQFCIFQILKNCKNEQVKKDFSNLKDKLFVENDENPDKRLAILIKFIGRSNFPTWIYIKHKCTRSISVLVTNLY